MADWVTRVSKDQSEALLRLHAFVQEAEKLRPHTVLKIMDAALLNAENRLIIAPNADAQEAAIFGLIQALNALGQSHESTKKLVDDWVHARNAIAEEHALQQGFCGR